MAHEHVYGICENKCMVEVLPKSQSYTKDQLYTKDEVYNKNEVYTKSQLYTKDEISETRLSAKVENGSNTGCVDVNTEDDNPVPVEGLTLHTNRSGMCMLSGRITLFGETFRANTSRFLDTLLTDFKPPATAYGEAHWQSNAGSVYVLPSGKIKVYFYSDIDATSTTKNMSFSVTYLRA